VLSAMWNK